MATKRRGPVVPDDVPCSTCDAITWRRVGERLLEDQSAGGIELRRDKVPDNRPWDWTCERCGYSVRPTDRLELLVEGHPALCVMQLTELDREVGQGGYLVLTDAAHDSRRAEAARVLGRPARHAPAMRGRSNDGAPARQPSGSRSWMSFQARSRAVTR